MEDTKTNAVLSIVLAILIIIAIVIVIINPNKVENIVETNKQVEENSTVQEENNNEINEQEEKIVSMQEGGTLCKIGNNIVFYEDANKTIYKYDITENKAEKILTVEHEINKVYYDGENIYYIPSYHSAKGIYKVDLQGNVQKINDNASLQLLITENKIYFVQQIGYDDFNHNPQGTLCSMHKDGSNVVEIAKNVKNYFYLNNDKIYYTTQDRKMYAINQDGTSQENIEQGRKFVNNMSDKYLFYIDYANQEAEHILNLETKEDSIIGYYGLIKNCQDKTYVAARKRLDDGSIDIQFTLFEIEKTGEIKEIGKITGTGMQLKYVSDGKVYISTETEGIYSINLENNQKENLDNELYFIGGYAYGIDDSNLEDIKIKRIEL